MRLIDDLSLKRYEDKVLMKEVGAMTDVLYASHIAYDKGVRRGERHGLRRGKAEGAADAKREMAKAMLAKGIPLATIAEVSGLSEEEIKAL